MKVSDIVAAELAQLDIARSTDVGASRPDPTNDMRADKPRPCKGCRRLHGSVNEAFVCLETALEEARTALAIAVQDVADLSHEIVPQRQLKAEVKAVNERFPSHVGERGK